MRETILYTNIKFSHLVLAIPGFPGDTFYCKHLSINSFSQEQQTWLGNRKIYTKNSLVFTLLTHLAVNEKKVDTGQQTSTEKNQ